MHKQLIEFGLVLAAVIILGILAPVYTAEPDVGRQDSAAVPYQANG